MVGRSHSSWGRIEQLLAGGLKYLEDWVCLGRGVRTQLQCFGYCVKEIGGGLAIAGIPCPAATRAVDVTTLGDCPFFV